MREVDVFYPEEHSKLSIEGGSSTGLVLRGSMRWETKRDLQSWYRRGRRGANQRREIGPAELWKDRGLGSFTNKGWSQVSRALEFQVGSQ